MRAPISPHRRLTRTLARLSVGLLLVALLPSLTACATWDWLWSRDGGEGIDSDRLVLGGTEVETDIVFDGAVEFDESKTHRGTDIYYIGTPGHENRSRIVVIDAGHQEVGSAALEPNGPGSEIMKEEVTWGATGEFTGQTEYDLNLQVALLLRNELIRRGYSVVMIRETNNVSVSNRERAAIANKYRTPSTVYLRIHANSWTDESMHGAMTISQSAANPYPTCAAHYAESRLLSELVLEDFCEKTGIQQLPMREMDNMTGTNWSEVPTTIVEMGFLSNQSDDTIMTTEYFRQEAAVGMANGISAYFARMEELVAESASETALAEVDAVAPAETSADE